MVASDKSVRRPRWTLRGGNGVLEVYDDRLLIRRRGLDSDPARTGRDDIIVIYYRDIAYFDIQWTPVDYPGSVLLQFTLKDRAAAPIRFIFDHEHEQIARSIVEYLDDKLHSLYDVD